MRRLMWVAVLAGCACAAAAAAAPTDGLVAYWPFDEGSGTVAGDRSGNGNNGVIKGATWTEGVSGAALRFAGNGFVEVPTSPSLGIRDSITVAAWIYLTEYPDRKVSWGFRTIVIKPGAYHLVLVADGGLTFRALNDGAIRREVPPDFDFTLKRWHHVAVTYGMAHNEQHIYIDGVERPVGNPKRVFAVDANSANLRIGNQKGGGPKKGDSNFWVGLIDEVRLYNRPLSAAEVAELYRANATPAR